MNLIPFVRKAASFALLAAAAIPAEAQDCTIPPGFDPKLAARSLINWFGDAGTVCKLRTQFLTTTDPMAAGVVPYRFPGGVQQVRLRFALDFSLLTVNSLNRTTGVLTIGGTDVVLVGAFVARVHLVGQPGGKLIRLILPQPANTSWGYQSVDIPLGDVSTAQLGFDLQLGTAGYLNYWINAGFDAPPTGRIPASGYLDFSARGPATGFTLGLFSGSSVFLQDNLAKDLVISDIVVTDYIFRSRFE